jgi:nitroreductase
LWCCDGLSDLPAVYHYAPDEHILEVRAKFSSSIWDELSGNLTEGAILIGLTSIFWREAWKYGERAYRYCQHDIGHAIAAINIAASGLGWGVRLLMGIGSHQISTLLGLSRERDPESEHPEVILVVYPQERSCDACTLPAEEVSKFENFDWQGKPNRLSPLHRDWSIITEVAKATSRQVSQMEYYGTSGRGIQYRADISTTSSDGPTLRELVRGRRSAVAYDGSTHIERDTFYKILQGTMPAPQRISFQPVPWTPLVHLLIFVHLVDGIEPGLYLLVRDTTQIENLRRAITSEFAWKSVTNKPDNLDFYLLAAGDARHLSRQISCHQDIAAYGCFSLGMIAHFEPVLRESGAWFYPFLFWECGMIGQMLYLEAESAGLRGTGIGCYFDDAMHSVLSINDLAYQDLYHFTIGSPLEDLRLTTFTAYSGDD